MYRTAMRTATRPALRTTTTTSTTTTTTRTLLRPTPASRRLASTTPANRPRTWKGSLARWGLVAGAVYYYNTSPVFADEVVSAAAGSSSSSRGTIDAPPQFDDSELPTVDSVLENKRRQIQARLEKKHEASPAEKADGPAASATTGEGVDAGAQEGAGALEEEAGQQGAFNPETGEINWDCPCLGGMAHGPCGEEFRTAFSCFVYSNEEPKGMDCIEKFQSMQGCFRQYPDIYGAELNAEDEAEAEAELDAQPAAQNVDDQNVTPKGQNGEGGHQKIREGPSPSPAAQASRDSTKPREEEKNEPALPDASPDAAPTKWSDATAANDDVKRKNKPKDATREA